MLPMHPTCWSLLAMLKIPLSSAKSDLSTPFPNSPNIPLIATRRGVTLSTPLWNVSFHSHHIVPLVIFLFRQISKLFAVCWIKMYAWVQLLFSLFALQIVLSNWSSLYWSCHWKSNFSRFSVSAGLLFILKRCLSFSFSLHKSSLQILIIRVIYI